MFNVTWSSQPGCEDQYHWLAQHMCHAWSTHESTDCLAHFSSQCQASRWPAAPAVAPSHGDCRARSCCRSWEQSHHTWWATVHAHSTWLYLKKSNLETVQLLKKAFTYFITRMSLLTPVEASGVWPMLGEDVNIKAVVLLLFILLSHHHGHHQCQQQTTQPQPHHVCLVLLKLIKSRLSF